MNKKKIKQSLEIIAEKMAAMAAREKFIQLSAEEKYLEIAKQARKEAEEL